MADQLEYNISLERLTLDSFRCFGELKVHFDEKLTVFIAENGGGKTALLDAIVEGLKAHLAALKVDGFNIPSVAYRDIKKGEGYAKITLETDVDYVLQVEYENLDKKDDNGNSIFDNVSTMFNAQIPILVSSSRTEVETGLYQQYNLADPIPRHEDLNLPVLVYYGGDSVHVTYREKEDTNLNKLQMIYNNALDSERLDFTTFRNWYKHNEDRVFRAKDKTSPAVQTINEQFSKLGNAIEYMLNDDPENPVYTGLRINEDLEMGMDKKTPDGGTQFVAISQFSSGERALFAFVADLGLRLLHAHPLEKRTSAVEDVAADDTAHSIRGKGIVLIDEVDLHLHPKWQRKVVGKLMDIFPDVQWVMTTHSPFVLSNVLTEQARVIRDNRCYMVRDLLPDFSSYGANLERIITLLFKVSDYMPEEVNELFEQYFAAIDADDFDKAVKLEGELIALTDKNHPKLIEGRAQIEYKELLSTVNL